MSFLHLGSIKLIEFPRMFSYEPPSESKNAGSNAAFGKRKIPDFSRIRAELIF